MGARSLRVSLEGKKKAKTALINCSLTQQKLADALGVSRQPINKFFTCKPVDTLLFVDICKRLKLNWEEIAEPNNEIEDEEKTNDESSISALVQNVRQKISASIQERCGTMRVLDMTQPIGLGDIYTDVNILEKISGRRGLNITDLLQNFDPESENFDRCGLGRVTEKRVPGLEAVKHHPKLMVLGKPGAGKTTFLKYLAIQCNSGQFQGDRIPVFITLKQFAETRHHPNLQEFILQQLPKHEVTDTQLSELLSRGRLLLLLDGLDEVKEEDSKRIIDEIVEFATQYYQNQFVITCRIAAKEYTFAHFTEVEVADFDDKQIKIFVTKWFKQKDPKAAKQFIKKLKLNEPINELATNPLLLTLLCLEFEDSYDFPSDRAELYSRAIHTLLRKWDTKRGIVREEVYKKLSIRHKEDLLSQVAFLTFERKDYFFKQRDAEGYIADYIRNLPEAKKDPDALRLDSEAVLKSIEAQHGLLVERARGIYSFSHLTFQEYFTARRIKENHSDELLQNLVSHIIEKRWQEVFLLTAGMLVSANKLLLLMKEECDRLLVGDEHLQQFLRWVNKKSCSVNASYKAVAIRAFYLSLSLDFDISRILTRTLHRDLSLSLDFDLHLSHALDRDLARDLDLTHDRILTRTLNRDLDLDRDLDRVLDITRTLTRDPPFDGDLDLNLTLNLALNLAPALSRTLDLNLEPELKRAIQELKAQLPSSKERKIVQKWYQQNGKKWITAFRNVMIKYRNIGHDWQFTDLQKKLINEYYYANRLLVDCLNSDAYISRDVREEIENTLLLPYQPKDL